MTILPLLYWILLILSVVGVVGPASWPAYRFVPVLALFVIIGLRIFRIPIQ